MIENPCEKCSDVINNRVKEKRIDELNEEVMKLRKSIISLQMWILFFIFIIYCLFRVNS